GIPKTIDNDVRYVTRTFGYGTAVAEATRVIQSAHTEARSVDNGVSVVKLMGRHAGFIAAAATVASQEVNFCLVPEVPFALEGESGLFAALERRLARKAHAVVVVAEGAGQDLLGSSNERDASGNLKFGDIGVFLKERIGAYFQKLGMDATLKYIDPSYIIRGVPANPYDSAFCLLLGQNAVHAGMAGRTNMVVGLWMGTFTHMPIPLAVSQRKKVDPESWVWSSVLTSTGQPKDMR
ncbi:MAG TPA: 6-phosphofructokinase, partial [Desulfobacterales bacterium]|nr:6-phosphofructokinase [Desulfobacterales bacterium]